jgi:hypothetical protein
MVFHQLFGEGEIVREGAGAPSRQGYSLPWGDINSIYPPSPLPLIKEGGIFTNGMLLSGISAIKARVCMKR